MIAIAAMRARFFIGSGVAGIDSVCRYSHQLTNQRNLRIQADCVIVTPAREHVDARQKREAAEEHLARRLRVVVRRRAQRVRIQRVHSVVDLHGSAAASKRAQVSEEARKKN